MPYTTTDERHRGTVRALCVAILAAAYMIAVGGEIPVYTDTIEDMLVARDGMVFGIFDGGSRTTFPGVGQGVLWIRFLASTFALGLGVVGQQVIMVVLAALSVAAFDHGVRKCFGEDIGWELVGVFLPLLLFAIVYPIASPGYLGPLVLVASTLALLYVVTSGSVVAAIVCGVSLAFVGELHVVALLGVPISILTVAMSCRRPILASSLGIASGIAAASVLSFNAWVNNVKGFLQQPPYVMLIAGGLVGTLLVALSGRRRWLALDAERQRLLLLVGIVGSIVAQVIAASTLGHRTLIMPHYLLFAVPALSILVALGLRRLRALGVMGRIVAVAIPLALLSTRLLPTLAWRYGISTGIVSIPNYSMREVDILARHFWAKGYSFPDVQRHLRGPQTFDLMGAFAVFAPSPDGPLERPMEDLRVLAFSERNRPDGPIPAGGEEVDLGRGRRAWILPLDGWVRLAPSRACFKDVSTVASEANCVDIDSASIGYTGRYRDLFDRSLPALSEARRRFDGRSRETFEWNLPIEITGEDEERHFDIVGMIGVAPWTIERVEGVSYRGDLPARHVVLERSEKRSGRLVLAAAPSGMTLKDFPPDFLETRPGEGALRASLKRLPPLAGRICPSLGTCPADTPE